MTHLPGEIDTADELRARLSPTIDRESKASGVDPRLLRSLLEQESGFSPDVAYGRRVSSAGAKGVAQFIDATAADFNLNPLDPEDSVRAAAQFLGQNLRRYDGDYTLALAAYNWGPGSVDRLLRRFEGQDVTSEQLASQLPNETQLYLERIGSFSNAQGFQLSGALRNAGKSGLDNVFEFVDTFIPGGTSETTFRVPSIPGVSGAVNSGFDAAAGGIQNPLKTITTIGDFLAFITDPKNIARVALTGAAVGMIGLGVVVFVFSQPAGRKAAATVGGGAVGGPVGAAAGAAATE